MLGVQDSNLESKINDCFECAGGMELQHSCTSKCLGINQEQLFDISALQRPDCTFWPMQFFLKTFYFFEDMRELSKSVYYRPVWNSYAMKGKCLHIEITLRRPVFLSLFQISKTTCIFSSATNSDLLQVKMLKCMYFHQ